MTTGLLRRVDADVLAQMPADLIYCPAPLADQDLAAVMATPELAEILSDTQAQGLLPVGRPLSRTDRVLLCGRLDHPPLRARAALALANNADVWVLESPEVAVALALIETLGITLCDWQPRPVEGGGIVCLGATRDVHQSNHIGRLGALELHSHGSAGYFDEQGWLHILGTRANWFAVDELVLTPFEGVARLETHARVTGACLLALEDDRAQRIGMPAGFFACAEVTGEASPVLEVELLEYVRRGLSAVKCPQGIMLVDVLPRTGSGAPDLAAIWALVA